MTTELVPAGYLYKHVVVKPDWLTGAPHVQEIYSVSGCISHAFADYIRFWKHNGYWVFDSPDIMKDIARSESIDLTKYTLFYYEILTSQYDEETSAWSSYPAFEFPVNVEVPIEKTLRGFDICSASQQNTAECSPLSCNHLASEIPVNAYCLFETLEEAKAALEAGRFHHSEPGPFRIYAVYTLGAA